MENFNQIFSLLAKSEGIGLNLDILETGLINIIALVAILIYTVGDFLKVNLEERKLTVTKSIEDAENKLKEAKFSWKADMWEAGLNWLNDPFEGKRVAIKRAQNAWEKDAMHFNKYWPSRIQGLKTSLISKFQGLQSELKDELYAFLFDLLVLKVKTIYSPENKIAHSTLFDATINSLEGDLAWL